MACTDHHGPFQQHLETATTVLACYWLTAWFPCVGLDKLKGVLKIRNVTGNFQAQPVFQLASVRTDKPDAALPQGSLAGAGEVCSGELDISTDTDDKQFMRIGIAYALSSGTTLGSGDVTLEADTVACGRIVSTMTQTLTAYSTGSTVTPISGFIPAAQVAKWKLAAIISGLTGTAQWRLVWRPATTSTEAPSAWTTTESYRNTNNVEVNTGEIATSITSDMYVQAGIEVSLSSGSTPAQLTITSILGARRA